MQVQLRRRVLVMPDHDGDSSQPRRKKKTKDRHEDPVPQRQASTKTSSTATPVSAASNGQRRDSTARYEATLTDDDCLEARLERVLHIVEENGFDSIDSMASTYYTSELLDDSFLRPIQATSRTRRLRSLISDLQASHKSWNGRERRAFAGEVVRSAEGICSDELGAFQGSRAPLPTSPLHRRTSSSLREPSVKDQKSASLESKRSEIARRIRDVLSSPDICEFLQKDQAALQSSVGGLHPIL
ncbi:hypothetical protein LZ30DRAFT_781994 [Colletotrichum cereale]|nr:hypothetical protein LZ30DRAFT_781994 [Colletotrichum cereale]